MFVLDTNVVSEFMRPAPDAAVVAWVSPQPLPILYTTSVTQAEILYGLRLLPQGRRRERLEAAAGQMFAEDFAGRILPFDQRAAAHYARIVAERRRQGSPVSQFDAQIAAIVLAAGATLVTANVRDFEGCGVKLVNPWRK